MRNVLLVGLAVGLVSSVAMAHDGYFNVSFSDWTSLTEQHEDDAPWKGFAIVTVQNSSQNEWGDFHFEIVNGPNVFFTEEQASWTTQPGATYQISPSGTALDFEFYANPILPGATATFAVYTDNTADQNSFFGLMMWPTPVPEPASLLLLGLGGLALIRRRS
jgi:hypothetical protein